MSQQTPTGSTGSGTPDGPDERASRETDAGDPVDLGDRTAPGDSGTGYSGSPVGNQGTSEPMPTTPGHRDPNAPLKPPLLGDMNVGAADPQSPRHPAAAGSGLSLDVEPAAAPAALGGRGTVPSEDRPIPSAGSSTGRATGPEQPVSASDGSSHRVPGLAGTTGPDEAVETDVVSSAARMGPSGAPSLPPTDEPGDAQGVPVLSHDAAAGTSEEHAAARGARTPSTTD